MDKEKILDFILTEYVFEDMLKGKNLKKPSKDYLQGKLDCLKMLYLFIKEERYTWE